MLAVIESGSKQFLVEKGQTIAVELLSDQKTVKFTPLLIIDGDDIKVGKPTVENAEVTAEVTDKDVAGKKINVLKYKPKKRQSTRTGHRQHFTNLTITSIKTK